MARKEKDVKIMSKAEREKEMDLLMIRFIDNHPFYSELLTQFVRYEDEKIPTLGVYIAEQKCYMPYNPNFVFGQAPNVQVGLIQHEILHLILNHLLRVKERNRLAWNIATDLAINENLIAKKDLPEEGCFFSNMGLPGNKSSEEYYQLVMKDAKKMQKMIQDGMGQQSPLCPHCKGSGVDPDNPKEKCPECNGTGKVPQEKNIGDHDIWTVKGSDPEGLDEGLIREMVQKAVDKCHGNLPGNLVHVVNELLKPPKVNWQQVIRMFVNKNCRGMRENSWLRWNRRMPGLIKGRKRARVPKLACLIDSSGSISDAQLDAFCNEIRHIQKQVPTHVIVFDVDVHDSYEFTGTFNKIKARGGTDFRAAFKAAKEIENVGAIVMLSDGYGTYPDMKDAPYPQTLIVLTKDGHDLKDWPYQITKIKIDV